MRVTLCLLLLLLRFLILNLLCLLRRTPSNGNSNSFSAAAAACATVSVSAAAWTTSCHPCRPCSHSHSHSHLPSQGVRAPGLWPLPSSRRVGDETQEQQQRRSRIPRSTGGGGGGGMRRPSSCCCRCCGRRDGAGDDDQDCQVDDDDAEEGKPEPTASKGKERGAEAEAAEDGPGKSSGSRRLRDGAGAAALPKPASLLAPAPGRVLPPSRPLLAVVTEPTRCDTEPQLVAALASLSRAVATDPGRVDLVIVRLEAPSIPPSSPQRNDAAEGAAMALQDDARFDAYRQRVRRLLRTLVRWSSTGLAGKVEEEDDDDGGSGSGGGGSSSSSIVSNGLPPPRMKKKFLVVVSSGLLLAEPPMLGDVEDASAMPDGVHVKESHRDQLPAILGRIKADPNRPKVVVVGMSCHSVMSAVEACTRYRPDYLLAGTCYPTLSHPEKKQCDVEGPDLPGQIRRELERTALGSSTSYVLGRSDDTAGVITEHPLYGNSPRRPLVLGIGGIDAANCGRVVRGGADGVAVIRSVLAAPDPAEAVQRIADEMDRACCCGDDDDAASAG